MIRCAGLLDRGANDTSHEDLVMALRINVTAVRHCPLEEVRAVMSEVLRKPACAEDSCGPIGDLLELHEHNGWLWFTTSVWGVSSGDLNRGLCKLSRPALQFTTSDGDRWYLSIHGGPQGQVHFLHEFSYHSHVPDPAEDADWQERLDQHEEPPVDPRLAFLEDDPQPGPSVPKAPFDLIADALKELGGHVPDEFRASVAHLPYSAAAARYREWHAEQVCDALTAAGIPHGRSAVRSVLLWEDRVGADGGDLGNLPWLLSVLGLGGEWDDYVRQAEAPPAPEPEPEAPPVMEAPPQPEPEREDVFGPVLTLVEPLVLMTVAGGPFAVPLDDLAVIRFFVESLSIHDTAGVVLSVTLPAEFDPARIPAPAAIDGSAERTANGFRAGMDNHLWLGKKDLTNQLGEELAWLLYHLPDGSRIDLDFALADRPALMQRYRGTVEGGQWLIRETFPPLTCEALAGGMELARYQLTDPEKHELRDEAEAEAVVDLARRDPNLWDSKVQRKGRTVWCKSDIIGHLVKVLFRHRFKAHWNVAAHDVVAAQQYEQHLELQRRMRRGGAEAARRRAAPHDDKVLLHGRCGLYWRSDFTRLEDLEQETRTKFDEALSSLNFRHVGDMVAKKQRDMVLRTWASPDGFSFAVLKGKRTMYLGYEFFSRFVDGSILITTTNPAEGSEPILKLYCKAHPGLEVAALYEKHRKGIERFRTRKGIEPIPLTPTLLSVARECDRALARRHGVSLRIRILTPPPGEAPAHVRAAWVGCELPVFATTDDSRVGQQMKGTLSGRKAEHFDGFTVQSIEAVAALERHDAAAARWWREKASQVIQPGKLFAFPTDTCELIEEIDVQV
jgi:hypothetical protein